MYNPLQFFSPVNARFDQAGGIATQIAETNRLRDSRAKQEQQKQMQRAGAERYIGLQSLVDGGTLEGDAEGLRIAQEGMRGGALDALGAEGYFDFQMKQQQAEARRQAEQKMSDPRIIALREAQDESFLKGQELLSEAIKTTDSVKRDNLMMEYKSVLAENLQADRQLTAFGLPSHAKRPLPSWTKGLGGMAKQLGAEDIAKALVKKEEAQATKYQAEADDIKGRLALSRQMQTENLAKIKEDRGYKAHNQITKVLKDSGLSEPSVYDSIIEDARFAVEKKNIFTAVKLLSNVIEPGLSVTEGEVEGYTVGGTSKFNKFLQKMGGAGESDMNRILELLKGIANNRKKQAQNIISRGGERSTSTSATPKAKITSWDDL